MKFVVLEASDCNSRPASITVDSSDVTSAQDTSSGHAHSDEVVANQMRGSVSRETGRQDHHTMISIVATLERSSSNGELSFISVYHLSVSQSLCLSIPLSTICPSILQSVNPCPSTSVCQPSVYQFLSFNLSVNSSVCQSLCQPSVHQFLYLSTICLLIPLSTTCLSISLSIRWRAGSPAVAFRYDM